MLKKDIFISYDRGRDKNYKNLLNAWDDNGRFNFSFYDHVDDVVTGDAIADSITQSLISKIDQVSHFICIVGENTHKSHWVKWEITKAIRLKKKLIAVKTNAANMLPSELLSANVSWANLFTEASVLDAIEQA